MKKLLFIILLLGGIWPVKAQDTLKFKPSGRPEALIFTNFSSTFSDGRNINKFDITRAYLGYGYNFSPTLSGRAVLDVSNPGVGGLQMTAFLKNAYMQYQGPHLMVRFGMIPTIAYDVQEKFWGNRYVLKSFQDQYGMNPSADLGLSVAYKFNSIISADAMLENGEGFKVLEVDSVLKAGAGLTLHPLKSIIVRGYYDRMKKGNATQQTQAVMIGFKNEAFSLAAEYNRQTDYKLNKGQNWSGYSTYGTFYFNDRADLFARYDYLTSENIRDASEAWNFRKDGQLYMVGLEFIPVKGIRIAPNYQLWNPRDNTKSKISFIFLNVEIRM